ncbi:carbon-nitrogen hydrolase family protein [Alteribacillus iranensis]|uniref:Predicted amidohydrolase n=1 Tax=Alteribacillus iranensis TaxID=930128 RepID=A0A1I2BG53_9BACI|nr:carbon-nitrogen hydrolase family protein [Alteribacillus iranensis]SFE54858.1 Predicted amidohydrolase [Alteribacillus iranensis]
MSERVMKLALAQLRCELLDKEYNLRRILFSIESANKKGADFILFPELCLSGYMMSTELYRIAEPVTGDSIMKIAETAKENNIGVVVGFPEKEGEKLYNSAAVIDRDGSLLCTYRKTHLYHTEHDFFTPGDRFPTIELGVGKVGILITYDMEFPEAPRILAKKGVEIILVLEANMVPYQKHQDIYLRSRALENHIYMAATNKVGLHVDNVFFGESQIVHPNGHSLYKAGNNEELPVIEVPLNEAKAAVGVLDYLNNRREDLYM